MGFPVKKSYRTGSPGAERREFRVTLASIKKQIRASNNRTVARRQFREQGLLGPVAAS